MVHSKEIEIPLAGVTLKGNLDIPEGAKAMVVFVHGSGSSRLSPRNTLVANYLQQFSLGTLLFDLLTEEEDKEYANRFNIHLLTQRLLGATAWLQHQAEASGKPIGFFGASTGAAAALKAAAALPGIRVVVSRGGRPDLAGNILPYVHAATLLIVGEMDFDVLQLNYEAFNALTCVKKVEIVEGATHLFEEPGAMEQVSSLAADWFREYLL